MLTAKQRDELLIRIDERVSKLRDDMRTAKGDTGFARCQVHSTEMNTIKNWFKWSKRLVVGAILSLIIGGVWRYISNFFTKRV